MSLFESFDMICEAVSIMVAIIRKQQIVIEQYKIEVKDAELEHQLNSVERFLNSAESTAKDM